MRKYLELFKEGFPSDMSDRTAIENWPYVGHDANGGVVYTVVPKPAVSGPYVTFTAEEDNSSIGLAKLSTNQTLEYSIDASTWNTFDTTTNISLNNGNKVYIRGILSEDNTTSDYTQFKMSGKIAASGNCNALWNYQDLNAPLKACCGLSMFDYCTSLTTAPELPATTLAERCYCCMFYECTSLTTAPELPATTLAEYCYVSMFYGCTNLTTAPELPAMELANNCYTMMFSDCTSLTTAPELPATTLADNCYSYMLRDCTSLTTAPELPATTLADNCYRGMFQNCTSLTTAPALPATVLADSCYGNMFKDCTSITTAPELPATNLVYNCYGEMFNGCSNLNYIACLVIDESAVYDYTTNWVKDVSSTGTFIKHPNMKKWSISNSGIPSGWTVVDAEL